MVDVAIKALSRNRLQTGLTMLGITVGVATVLAMMAVGSGAQRSIEQQVGGRPEPDHHPRRQLAAQVEESDEAIAHQGDARDSSSIPPDRPSTRRRPCKIAFHPEDDPMAKHDHPTARQRLGDLEAGLARRRP